MQAGVVRLAAAPLARVLPGEGEDALQLLPRVAVLALHRLHRPVTLASSQTTDAALTYSSRAVLWKSWSAFVFWI